MKLELSFVYVVYLFIAGMVGALLRFLIIELVTYCYDKSIKKLPYPHHTFIVNVIACFLMGYFTGHAPKNPMMQGIITIGFLGAFSTFSTYIADVASHLREKKTSFALTYALTTLVFSFGGGIFGRFVAGGVL